MGKQYHVGGGVAAASCKPLRDLLLVRMVYDPPEVYSLYVPEQFRDPLPQQGEVIAVGKDQKVVRPGDYLVFHPWGSREVYNKGSFELDVGECAFLTLDVVAGLLAPDGELFPLPDHVLVKPEFSTQGRPEKKGLIWTVGQTFSVAPPQEGVVAKVGEDVTLVCRGDRVMFPDDKGSEIGLIDKVWYAIKETDLLVVQK